MKLFLTSQASDSLEKIVPLLPKKPSELTVAFIPTAADNSPIRPWVDVDKDKLIALGFNIFEIGLQAEIDNAGYPIPDTNKSPKKLFQELSKADIIFVAGGNTFYLLEQAQKMGFLEMVKNLVKQDVIYIGSSAGSVIAGPDIEPIAMFDDPNEANLKSTKGLNYVDFVILPHFWPGDRSFEQTFKKYGERYNLIPLINENLIMVDESGYKII